MKSYWMSFRIKNDAGYADAYDSLVKAVGEVADQTNWWSETTSFYIFQSENSTDQIANHLKQSIRPDRDLIVLGLPNYKGGRVIGKCDDQDIFDLFPGMKKH